MVYLVYVQWNYNTSKYAFKFRHKGKGVYLGSPISKFVVYEISYLKKNVFFICLSVHIEVPSWKN